MQNSERWLVRVAVCFLVALTVQPATAAPPIATTRHVDFSQPSRTWTRRCGFPVWIRDEGTVTFRLFYQADGLTVLGEIDTSPSYRHTWFSPLTAGGTGGSYSTPQTAMIKTVYPNGAYLGAPATASISGLQELAPSGPDAGRQVFLAEVIYVDADGIPYIDIVSPANSHGTFNDFQTFVTAICGAIAHP